MKVKRSKEHLISFQLVKPGTLFRGPDGQYYIKTESTGVVVNVDNGATSLFAAATSVIPLLNATIDLGETS